MLRSSSPTKECAWSWLPTEYHLLSCALEKQARIAARLVSDRALVIISSMRPSHFSTPRQTPAAPTVCTFAATSLTGTAGAHVFLCRFQFAFWHAAPQYQVSLQTEQRWNPNPSLPQWAHLATFAAIAGAGQQD